MTSARVENLEFDTGQRERSAHVMDKQPSDADKTPQGARGAGQEAGPASENH
jgi:hypothetical protein